MRWFTWLRSLSLPFTGLFFQSFACRSLFICGLRTFCVLCAFVYAIVHVCLFSACSACYSCVQFFADLHLIVNFVWNHRSFRLSCSVRASVSAVYLIYSSRLILQRVTLVQAIRMLYRRRVVIVSTTHVWPMSQEANKSSGTRCICHATFQLHLRDNTWVRFQTPLFFTS
jgi:hypothetical protein